jgi:hypothetical protein
VIVQASAAYAAARALPHSARRQQGAAVTAASAAAIVTSADTVTISPAARERLAASTEPRSCASIHKWATEAAQAEDLANLFARMNDAPLVDISESVKGTGPIRYAATGEPMSEEIDAWFQTAAQSAQVGRLALYNAEKAKGTPAADILDKIFAYNDAQPARYKELMAWSGAASRT